MLSMLATALVLTLATQTPQPDPEQTAAGRSQFLGREVAQTMHWTGAAWLMRATREREENGALLRRWLAVQPGQSVCDFGCGNGYHTLPLGEAVGEQGKVFAVDLQPQMLTLLQQRCEQNDLHNVTFVTATLDDPHLPRASCDLVLLVDVYHELSHPVRVMAHLRRALKPKGRIVLVEFRAEDPEVPIKPEHMMSKAQVVREMAAHGFALADQCDDLPWQHAMAFHPATITGPRFAARQMVAAFLHTAANGTPAEVQAFLQPGLLPKDVPPFPSGVQVELRAGETDTVRAMVRLPDGSDVAHGKSELQLRQDPNGRWQITAITNPSPQRYAYGSRRPFVLMDSAIGSGTTDERINRACDLKFDGVTWSRQPLRDARTACEARGTDLWASYVTINLADQKPAALADTQDRMQVLAGGPGMMWLHLTNPSLRPSDPKGDARALDVLTTLLRDADRTGVELALYPHHGSWLATIEDALRLCQQLPHARLGTCFNLCHFLHNHEATDPTDLLRQCGSRLFAVTINGADADGDDWATLIQPLDRGDLDVAPLLRALDELAFSGPIALQGYGILLPTSEHLPASMAAWRRLMQR